MCVDSKNQRESIVGLPGRQQNLGVMGTELAGGAGRGVLSVGNAHSFPLCSGDQGFMLCGLNMFTLKDT